MQSAQTSFAANATIQPLMDSQGTVDAYKIIDVLARHGRFDNQNAANTLAMASLYVDAALSYCEPDPGNGLNQNFVAGFARALRMFDRTSPQAGVKTVILPHDYSYFKGPERKAIRAYAAKHGITPTITLPSGVIVHFRDKAYDTDLSVIGPIRPQVSLLVPDPENTDKYLPAANISRLLLRDGRGMACASASIKSKWDTQVLDESRTAARQMDFGFTATYQQGAGNIASAKPL